jgi:hypothetical protein
MYADIITIGTRTPKLVKIEPFLPLSVVEAFGVWGRNALRRGDVIEASAMLIESDYEQSVLPIISAWALRVPDSLINLPYEPITE